MALVDQFLDDIYYSLLFGCIPAVIATLLALVRIGSLTRLFYVSVASLVLSNITFYLGGLIDTLSMRAVYQVYQLLGESIGYFTNWHPRDELITEAWYYSGSVIYFILIPLVFALLRRFYLVRCHKIKSQKPLVRYSRLCVFTSLVVLASLYSWQFYLAVLNNGFVTGGTWWFWEYVLRSGTIGGTWLSLADAINLIIGCCIYVVPMEVLISWRDIRHR